MSLWRNIFQNKNKIINFFVFAPPHAGKMLFLTGLYIKASEMATGPTNPSNYVLKLKSKIYGDDDYISITSIEDYQFTYDNGKKKLILHTVDYPGLILRYISTNLYQPELTGLQLEDGSSIDELTKPIAQSIIKSDRLIFIIDGGRYPNLENIGIIEFIDIFNNLLRHGKNVPRYIVITKCDLFEDEFKNYEDYEGFRKFIEEKFSKHTPIKILSMALESSDFYPVFVNYKDGKFYTYGFDKIINQLNI